MAVASDNWGLPMSYDPGKVFASLLLWYLDGSADALREFKFRSAEEERDVVFAIEEIFRLIQGWVGQPRDSKGGS
jgi:hypothetical protein